MCVCERESVCVCVRERVCVCVRESERERVVCVFFTVKITVNFVQCVVSDQNIMQNIRYLSILHPCFTFFKILQLCFQVLLNFAPIFG